MPVWDPSTPTGQDFRRDGATRIREAKEALEFALRGGAANGVHASFPGANPLTAPRFNPRGDRGTTAQRPTRGGLFFDTQKQDLMRDDGANWRTVATNIPAGTRKLFCQASAPVGFTKVTTAALNGRAARMASFNGGLSAGTFDVGNTVSLAHTHTVNPHTHPIFLDVTNSAVWAAPNPFSGPGTPISAPIAATWGLKTATFGSSFTTRSARMTTEAAPGTTSSLGNVTLAHVNVIIAEKS